MDGEISVAELADLIADGADVRVIDVRSPEAFERGHVPGSVNIPLSDLSARVEELEGAERVVTVCPHGKASVQAARLVASYEGTSDAVVESLSSGLEGWAADHDLEASADARSAVADAADAEGGDDPDAPF